MEELKAVEEAVNTQNEIVLADEESEQKRLVQEHKDFLSNPDNKKNAIALAHQIQKMVGANWFSVAALVNKSTETKESAHVKLQLCRQFKLVIVREGDHMDSKKAANQRLYKVVITDEECIEGVRRIMRYHQDVLDQLQHEIDVIEKKNTGN